MRCYKPGAQICSDAELFNGFGDRWIGWIKLILTVGKFLIMVNREYDNIIISKKGSRQDDYLSPLLFVLAADTFTETLEREEKWYFNRFISL